MGTSLVHKGIPNEEQRKEINGPLVKMIKYALEGLIKYQSKDIKGASYRYLINQSIRQYILPTDNIHISEVASVLWGKLFEGCSELPNMLMYTYQDKIQPSNTLSVKTCKGTNKKQIEEDIKAGDKRPYNSIFIDEHTTPVSDVVKALVEKFSQSNSISVFEIIELLDKIHITKMCKVENTQIKLNSHRIEPSEYLQLDASRIFDEITKNEKVMYPKILSENSLG